MNITVLDNREIMINSSDNLGTQNENNASIMNFNFPESFVNANKKIVFITDDGNYWDLITNNSYKITNAVTKYKNVSAYVWLVDTENDIDFRSKIWNINFNMNKQPDDVVPTEEEISGFDTMITQLNQGLEELDEEKIKLRREYEKVEEGLEDLDEALIQVNNVDIDVSKSGNTSTITITNKEGVEKNVQIEDGTDYVITQEDYQSIANVVETDITPLMPTKTSDLVNDSGFIDNTVNNLTNYYNKTTSDGKYALISESGYSLELSINSSTYVITLKLKNKNGTVLSTGTVDLPLETMVVNASYDSLTKEIVLTLQNGNTVRFSVADLVSGLQVEITSSNKLASDLVDDTNQTNKFVTTSEKTTWNEKYVKPSGGIPSTDLSSAVQTSLGKADTAVQDVSGKEDKTNKVTSIDDESTDTQYPSAKLLYDQLAEKQAEIDGLVTENALLKDQIPNGTAEGTNVQITDSSNLLIEDGVIKGYTSQVQYEGRNKFYVETGTKNGVTLSYDDDGAIVLNGTSTSSFITFRGIYETTNTTTLSVKNKEIQADTYVRTRDSSGILVQTLSLTYASTKSDTKTAPISITEITIGANNITYDNFKMYVQLEESTSATDFEPYVGGQASPNPSYPQTIHRVTGECNEKLQNRNLLPNTQTTQIVNGVTFTINEKKSIKINGTANAQTSLRINTIGNELSLTSDTYTISTKTILPTGVSLQGWHSEANNFVTINSGNNKASFTLANDVTNVRFQIVVTNGAQINNATIYPVLETGLTEHDFEPHAEQNAPLTLGNIELCKIGDYQDYLFKNVRTLRSGRVNPLFNADLDEGDWYKREEIEKVVLDGTQTGIRAPATEGYRFGIDLNGKTITSSVSEVAKLYSNKFKGISRDNSYSNIQGIAFSDSDKTYKDLIIYCKDTKNMTFAEFQTWLSNNTTEVYYPLETPTYTKITDTTLIAQLEAYYNSSTYRNVTNIITAGEDLAPIAGIVYKKDLTTLFNKLDSLEARLDLLEE